jgi:glutamate synthase domain-containing protein 1/glutamate synthase domain-containing protein 3
MDREALVRAILTSRERPAIGPARRKVDAEGGCGVIGMASSLPLGGRHLLQALAQMRNRGNGKGGGIAAVGLDGVAFGVPQRLVEEDYLLALAYLDGGAREDVEANHVAPAFEVDGVYEFPHLPGREAIAGLEVTPPEVVCYFVRVRPDARRELARSAGLEALEADALDDEVVYRNSYALNRAYYSATGDKRAFVLSHAKNLLVLKMVGYGDDVVRYYRLEDFPAHVWIGHHRYPTKGKVWHPGGAHPFIGMHEALVHNGDFANYSGLCSYLAQHGIAPLFLTDTEVAVLVFDLLHRTFGYPLEYVMEAMAPTTERDFTLLPPAKQEIYRMLQAVHLHGSPDGPWFFLLAQSDLRERVFRLIGITDTSMLRPQVFALQQGSASVGFAASEKQGIDAALESLSREDPRFWSRADMYWNARGGSHTDGGAFVFTVRPAARDARTMVCSDKFGRCIQPDPGKLPLAAIANGPGAAAAVVAVDHPLVHESLGAETLFAQVAELLPRWGYGEATAFLHALVRAATTDEARRRAFAVLGLLLDRPLAVGRMKRSCLRSMVDGSLETLVDGIRLCPTPHFRWLGADVALPAAGDATASLVIDARGFPPEGPNSLARAIVSLRQRGFRRFVVANVRGQRFIGSGLGPDSGDVAIDVYGSAGDYLASGLDGATVVVHGSGQDQLAQILKDGTLVVHGDVGQTFMYAAKGGSAFVLGNAAGRPLINAVGKPRVVINGTCLDYLAESFMAGDPLHGGGFVVVNGLAFDEDGRIVELDTPYPGGNLFSLASGGAIYLRDPHRRLSEDQLNGGEFATPSTADAGLVRPLLAENESLFGIPVVRLLTVDGALRPFESVYRKVRPFGHKALLPEEAWVRKE